MSLPLLGRGAQLRAPGVKAILPGGRGVWGAAPVGGGPPLPGEAVGCLRVFVRESLLCRTGSLCVPLHAVCRRLHHKLPEAGALVAWLPLTPSTWHRSWPSSMPCVHAWRLAPLNLARPHPHSTTRADLRRPPHSLGAASDQPSQAPTATSFPTKPP